MDHKVHHLVAVAKFIVIPGNMSDKVKSLRAPDQAPDSALESKAED